MKIIGYTMYRNKRLWFVKLIKYFSFDSFHQLRFSYVVLEFLHVTLLLGCVRSPLFKVLLNHWFFIYWQIELKRQKDNSSCDKLFHNLTKCNTCLLKTALWLSCGPILWHWCGVSFIEYLMKCITSGCLPSGMCFVLSFVLYL